MTMLVMNVEVMGIVHVSRTGSNACAALAAQMAVDNLGDQKAGSTALTPAVETLTEDPTNGHTGSAL
ncbi:hypothetical protein [Gluconobacter japonicus]|uniref:Uncharacterized protein n=1 Tax=Gluconobacter japonicus TaxID=376620 RepID=A0ABQ5WHH2_GLUJA|nr:hypothetical protein [Gluconobacter japonicus]GBR28358.1 hypothetical protein AA3271_2766 [Gluconobacter japonicus NBRC 3271]GLQ59627.1 hypothetical protein GCM10010937_14300 [Gluconobacter japonicus]